MRHKWITHYNKAPETQLATMEVLKAELESWPEVEVKQELLVNLGLFFQVLMILRCTQLLALLKIGCAQLFNFYYTFFIGRNGKGTIVNASW